MNLLRRGEYCNPKQPHSSSETGMTLVEVLVTLGISSIMMMGILELVNLSNRSTRNVTINADWNNFVSGVKLAVSLESSCRALLGNGRYTWTQAGGINGVGFLARLDRTSPTMVIADTAGTYPSFRLTSIKIEPQNSSLAPIPIPMAHSAASGPTSSDPQMMFQIYHGSLTLEGEKRSAGGMGAIGGSRLSTAVPVPVTLMVGPVSRLDGTPTPGTANQIYSCYVDRSGPEAACESLGGQYLSRASIPHCHIPTLTAFDHDISGAPSTLPPKGAAGEVTSASSYPGAKIQLFGEGGFLKPRPNDYAIGYNDQQMWFTIGGSPSASTFYEINNGAAVNAFVWNHYPDNGGTGVATPLMALDRDGTLVLGPEGSQRGYGTLGFGLGLGPGNVPGVPTEVIQSNFGLQNLEFKTKGQHRLTIRGQGHVVVGVSDDPPASGAAGDKDMKLIFADYTPGSGTAYSVLDFPRVQSSKNKGDLEFYAKGSSTDGVSRPHLRMKLGSNDGTGTAENKIYGSLIIDATTSLPTLPVRSEGNVNFNCGWVAVSGTSEAICPQERPFVVGGGGSCSVSSTLTVSEPANEGAPYNDRWHVSCVLADGSGAVPARNTYAYCCRR